MLFRSLKMSKGSVEKHYILNSIDIIKNVSLEATFELKANLLKMSGHPHDVIFAYHGTKSAVIDHILNDNFDDSKIQRMVYGRGHYFSEFPKTALNHSDDKRHLIFCKILPGKQYTGLDLTWPGFDSKLVEPDCENYSKMVVIQDKDQILPLCVFNFSYQS